MESALGVTNSALPTTVGSGPQYKEYLRTQFIYKDFKDLNLQAFPALVRNLFFHFDFTRIYSKSIY